MGKPPEHLRPAARSGGGLRNHCYLPGHNEAQQSLAATMLVSRHNAEPLLITCAIRTARSWHSGAAESMVPHPARHAWAQVERIIVLMAKVFGLESCMLSLCADQRVWIRNARGFAPGAFEWRWCAAR